MFLLGCDNVTVEMAVGPVFTDLSLGVQEGDRIGIVGSNGAGKSTLLRLLTGELVPQMGRVIRTGGVSVGLLGQQDSLADTTSVSQAVFGGRPQFEWASDEKIRGIVEALIGELSFESPIGRLSGGQRRRVDLARLLCGDYDVLALDEPTNHLDLMTIAWLADHLKKRWRKGRGALLLVTHDRWFLDEVCESMWEVHGRAIRSFEGGFSAYIEQRVERDRQERVMEIKRQNALRRELAWLSRGARARATKPKFHVETVQALVADVPELRNDLELKRMAMARIGKRVVEFHDVSMGFPVDRGANVEPITASSNIDGNFEAKEAIHWVLKDIDWILGPGDRIGIIGANGAGKTTLLRVLTGELKPSVGDVIIGETVRFAVLSQRLEGLSLWGTDRVRQVVSRFSHRVMLDGRDQTPAQLLESLGFSAADLNERVCDLSGGQRRRLALMLILLEEPNVIVLDEPGNDLDVDMLAALETLLDGWPGTLVLVTHDRYLIERTTDNQYALIDGHLRHLPGGVEEYVRLESQRNPAYQRLRESLALVPASSLASRTVSATEAHLESQAQKLLKDVEGHNPSTFVGDNTRTAAQATPLTQKPASLSALRRDLQKEVRSLEKRRETAAQRQTQARESLAAVDPSDYEGLMKAQAALNEMICAAEELDELWLEAAEQLEAVEASLHAGEAFS